MAYENDMPAPSAGPPGDPAAEAMAAEEQRGAAMQETAGAAAPVPDKPFTTAKLVALSKEMDKTVQKLAGKREEGAELPSLEWTPPEGSDKRWPEPIPAPIFAPLVALDSAAKDLGFDKHDLKLEGLSNDQGVTRTQAALKGMAKDKKFGDAIRGPVQPQEAAPPPDRSAMQPMDEEEAALAQGAM